MSFSYPEYLWFLPAIIALAAWLYRDRPRRARTWRELAQRGSVPSLRSVSLLVAAVSLVLAVSRPRFGAVVGPPLPPGHDIVLLIDTSRSMGVEDAAPNRLGVAIESAESLVNALLSEMASRAAVVAFAGRGVLRCPLTENLGAVIDVLHRLRVGTVQPGGTDLGAGLDAALEAFGEEEHAEGRSIVVFSDGEDLADHWRSRINRLVRAGVIVHVVAVGDPDQGHPVPAGNVGQMLMFEGREVLSKREDSSLEAIASATEGAVLKLGLAPIDLGTLYRGRIAPVARLKRQTMRVPERTEQFPVFLAVSSLFALAGCWPVGRPGPLRWIWARAGAAAMLAGLGAAFLGAEQGGNERGVAQYQAGSPSTAAQMVARGQIAYQSGHFDDALRNFEAATTAAPTHPVPLYNAAAALFQLQRYDEALARYEQSRQRSGAALRTKIDYAMGNTSLMLGDIPSAVASYDRCLASRARGPGLDAIRRDAAINRRFALEQAQPAVAPEGESEDDSEGTRQGRPPGTRKSGDEANEPAGDSGSRPPPGGSTSRDDEGRRSSSRSRRVGGGGGTNRNPGAPGESPDDRLDEALDRIRDALNRRLPEETPAQRSSADHFKDW